MKRLQRTTSIDVNFKTLVASLDADLAERDGDENAFYAQFNGITHLKHCVVYFLDDTPLACGAFKSFNDTTTVEVKRMYVSPAYRGKGLASLVLKELEVWAKEIGFTYSILETGLRQPEAIALYKKNGYKITPNYPPYIGITNSVCFRKELL